MTDHEFLNPQHRKRLPVVGTNIPWTGKRCRRVGRKRHQNQYRFDERVPGNNRHPPLHMVMPGARMQMMVVMKLAAPRMTPKPDSALYAPVDRRSCASMSKTFIDTGNLERSLYRVQIMRLAHMVLCHGHELTSGTILEPPGLRIYLADIETPRNTLRMASKLYSWRVRALQAVWTDAAGRFPWEQQPPDDLTQPLYGSLPADATGPER